ncbi:hypothetical protein Y1Q_0005660 [Alligator mississippiensis]|uniref:Uncharacterized protein n=1 Tax=Alligator mississippiensis TaxID=8496 RepID=A0A151MFE8_ALLMI|nr:hypothetical protein Y1Q_0005660 [Alligator mississippiensis]
MRGRGRASAPPPGKLAVGRNLAVAVPFPSASYRHPERSLGLSTAGRKSLALRSREPTEKHRGGVEGEEEQDTTMTGYDRFFPERTSVQRTCFYYMKIDNYTIIYQ